MSFFSPQEVANRDMYKLLTSVVVPRPIAWITSLDENGGVNAAPFSFFNLVGSDPAMVAVGLAPRPSGEGKDTALNIKLHQEFVVNIVPFELRHEMNITAVDFPYGASEVEAAGLKLAPSQFVKTPRLEDAAASLECRELQTVEIGRNRVVLAEVLGLWIPDAAVDATKFYVDATQLDIIGRMGGGGGYCRTTEIFNVERLNYEEWQALQDKND